MALAAAVEQQYFRQSGQQQVLYAYWRDAGDVARARLALDVANWYYQQLGIPYYLPTDLPGYAPKPTSPDAAIALAASLPVDAGGPAIADSTSAAGSGSGAAVAFRIEGDSGINYYGQDYCSFFPDDPICYGAPGYFGGGGDAGGGSAGGDGGPVYISNPVTIVIDQQGLTLADVSSRISGALATAAAAIATAVDSVLALALAGVQHALNAIGNELASVFHLLSRLAGYLLNFLKGLLLGVIHGLVAAVDAIGRMLKDVFANGIMPALQALQRLRDYLVKIYQRFLRPLLIVLQDLRKVLAILKAFHIGFATKLDNVLADIQSKISTPLLYLLRYTNAVANYINLILDARLFLQRPLFLASLNAYKGSAANLLINGMTSKPDPAAIAALQATPAPQTPAQSTAALNQYLATGDGSYSAVIQQQHDQLSVYLTQGVQ